MPTMPTPAAKSELTEAGHQVAVRSLVHNGAGDLFGIAVLPGGHGLVFGDDGSNTLEHVSSAG